MPPLPIIRSFSHDFVTNLLKYGTSCGVGSTARRVLDGFFTFCAREGVPRIMTFDLDLFIQGHSAMTLRLNR